MEITVTIFQVPDFGWCGLAGSDRGLAKIYLPEPGRGPLLARMRAEFPGSAVQQGFFRGLTQQLLSYFNGAEVSFGSCPLDFGPATPFQKRVWQAARAIGYGQVRTYGWLAGKIGCPGAARAVGTALGRNPLPLIIPCHRIIRSGGGLGGFSATEGIALKRRLLELEGAL